MTKLREDIRNVAIIAHVDHGKTTLVDELLKQSQTLDERTHLDERAMDSNDIEKERGITILAKNTAVAYNGTRINIMDTPGHADFGGEVERIMKMVDGVVLVVDAYEGTMPQTRFVLKKALEQNLIPIVVVNKIDKPSARPEEVVDEVLELFIELGADDDQLEFPVVYASAINGTSSLSDNPDDQEETMAPIFDTIIEHIPAPVDNSDEPLQFQVSLLDYNDFVGRIGIGRVFRGTVKVGDQVTLSKLDGTTKNFRVTKLFGFFGLERKEIQEAKAGDLIAVSGMEDIFVGETVTPTDAVEALPVLRIDEPTLQMTFLVNNSPFAGREGKWVTSRKIEERLLAELQTDVSLRVDPTNSPDKWTVSGRGELHLSILIETMRREGYELQVSRPEVIIKEIDGVKMEPFERVQALARNAFARQAQFGQHLARHELGQEGRGATIGREPHFHIGHRKHGIARSHQHVAGQRQRQARTGRCALHRCNHRLAAVAHGTDQVMQAFELGTALFNGQLAALGQLSQVTACTKVPAFAREHDGAHGGVGLGLRQCLGQRRVERGRQCVARSRVVVGEHQHRALAALQQRQWLLHGFSSDQVQ